MAAEKTASLPRSADDSLWSELFSSRLYKPTQGRITRQVTGGAVWLAFAIGAWRWYSTRIGIDWLSTRIGEQSTDVLVYVLPGAFLLLGLWFGYRLVNYPRFADFLIAVEAEMNKVTWPSQDELIRSSGVVIFLLAALTVVLFVFDVVWSIVFQWLGIR